MEVTIYFRPHTNTNAGYALTSGNRNPVLKSLKALAWMIDNKQDGVRVREMASELDIPPSSAHRLLTELTRADFVTQDSVSGRYALSLEFLRLANLVTAQSSIQNVAISQMQKLTEACNETSVLGIYDRRRMEFMFLAMVESSHPLRYSIAINKWLPLHAGSSGLAILAFLPDEEIDDLLQRGILEAVTSSTIIDRIQLEKEIAQIRRRGYAITHEQRISGAVGIGAPVFDHRGHVVADICLTIPEVRFDPDTERKIAGLVVESADNVTRITGGKKPNLIGVA